MLRREEEENASFAPAAAVGILLILLLHIGGAIVALSTERLCQDAPPSFISYATALLVAFMASAISILLMLFLLRSCSLKYNNCCRHLFYLVFVVSALLQLFGFLVKSYLYFEQVVPNCPEYSTIVVFGSILFAAELLFLLCSLIAGLLRIAIATQQICRADH